LDWFIAWEVDDYVSWDKHQQRDFDQLLRSSLIWHQQSQLLAYSNFLSDIKADFQHPLSKDQLYQFKQQLDNFWKNIVLKVEPDIVLLLGSISDKQLDELERNMGLKLLAVQQKYGSINSNEIQQNKTKKTTRFLRRFIGKLSEEQQAIVVNWSKANIDSEGEWLHNRQVWSNLFIVALNDRKSPAFQHDINQLFVYPEQLWDENYTRFIASRLESNIDLIIALQATLTDRQRSHFNKEIDKWISIFIELSSEAKSV
jgi:ethanolamine utilization protein EutP (predicted NTPase)